MHCLETKLETASCNWKENGFGLDRWGCYWEWLGQKLFLANAVWLLPLKRSPYKRIVFSIQSRNTGQSEYKKKNKSFWASQGLLIRHFVMYSFLKAVPLSQTKGTFPSTVDASARFGSNPSLRRWSFSLNSCRLKFGGSVALNLWLLPLFFPSHFFMCS